jgi:hypothetical protein
MFFINVFPKTILTLFITNKVIGHIAYVKTSGLRSFKGQVLVGSDNLSETRAARFF